MSTNNEKKIKKNDSDNDSLLNLKNNDNSFYEGKKKSSETVWQKDWRGKILYFSLVSLVLLGIGIPSGMASIGYWKKYNGDYTEIIENPVDNKIELAQNEVERIKNNSINTHYEKMIDNGWISKIKYDKDIKNITENAEKEIDEKIKNLKNEYGNNDWKNEWNKFLQINGFHTSENGGEQEYKDSKIADKLLSKQLKIYSSSNTLTEEYTSTNSLLDNISFKSSENEQNEILAISNSGKNDIEISNSFSPEDLMALYLWTFQPKIFNHSRLPFTLEGDNPLEATSLTVTHENLKAAHGFFKELDGGDFKPAAQINNGIQSTYNINLGENIDNSTVINFLASTTTTSSSIDIKKMINDAFLKVVEASSEEEIELIGTDAGSMTSSDLIRISQNTTLTNKFENNLYTSLINSNLLTPIGTPRDFASTVTINGKEYVVYVSSKGLQLVGQQIEGSEIIINQLNKENDVDDFKIDYDLFNSFSTWLTDNYENILVLDYLTDSIDDKGWFNIDVSSDMITPNLEINENFNTLEEEYTSIVFEYNISSPSKDIVYSKYDEISLFYEDNWKIYDNSSFKIKEGIEVLQWMTSENNNLYTVYDNLLTKIFGSSYKRSNN